MPGTDIKRCLKKTRDSQQNSLGCFNWIHAALALLVYSAADSYQQNQQVCHFTSLVVAKINRRLAFGGDIVGPLPFGLTKRQVLQGLVGFQLTRGDLFHSSGACSQARAKR